MHLFGPVKHCRPIAAERGHSPPTAASFNLKAISAATVLLSIGTRYLPSTKYPLSLVRASQQKRLAYATKHNIFPV